MRRGQNRAEIISARLGDMLLHDKTNLKAGFVGLLRVDATRLMNDYFFVSGDVDVKIECLNNGRFEIKILAEADRIKKFDSTIDY